MSPAKNPLRLVLLLVALCTALVTHAAEPPAAANLIDDKKAKALIEAGDARFEAAELQAAMDLYKAVIDRYPTSRWRFLARLKMGKQHLKEKKFELALDQFRRIDVDDNHDEAQRGESALQIGICFFEMGRIEEAFGELRKVIKNQIGRAHV